MKKYLLEWLYDFLSLTKSEQRGIVVFATLTVILSIALQIVPRCFHHEPADHSEYLDRIRAFRAAQNAYLDSLNLHKLQEKGTLDHAQAMAKLKPFPFDPNTLPDTGWMAMGLTPKQAATIIKYREKGGKFRRREDLKKIYLVSEGEYRVLEPYIQIVALDKKPKSRGKEKLSVKQKKPRFDMTEINSADSARLSDALNLPPWLAKRLVKFRNILGGFTRKDQLYEVYGFDSARVLSRWDFMVIDTSRVVKLDLNRADFRELVRHPYITYEMAQNITAFREQTDTPISAAMLLEKGVIDRGDYARLHPYLEP